MNEDRLFEMLSELKVHANVTNERLKTYNNSLEIHIKRTELLEKDMQTALLPIKTAKFLAAFCAGASTIWVFIQLVRTK